MAYARQRLRVVSNRHVKPRRIAVSKQSIGTIYINGVPHTYNPDLVYTNKVSVDKINEDAKPKRRKRVIIVRRR